MTRANGEDIELEPVSEREVPAPSPARQASPARSVSIARRAGEPLAQIWSSLFLAPERTAPKSVVVTSAEPREGTTQVAAGLALTGSLSEQGLRIALADFNPWRPRIAKLFGIAPSPGVVEVLAEQASMESAVVRAAAPRLDLFPAGQADEASLPLLRSQRVGELVRLLTENYHHVIIDAPAVNRHATAQALAGFTDGVVLVVKAGVTRRESVAEAKKRIEYAQGRVIGVVLNQRKFPIPGFLYRRL